MAAPRKVPFVTISSISTSPPSESKKRRREDEAEVSLGKDGGAGSTSAIVSGGCGSPFGNVKGGDGDSGETKRTVRLNLSLSEPSDRGSAEFNYSELVQTTQPKDKVKKPISGPPKGLAPPLDPGDPFADDEKERQEVEALAKKFESKYGNTGKKKRKDRMQDLIDIGYGYDETDPFIDNSEAYDELVPASLTTKLGGFYINTGTLQFRPTSDSEGEGAGAGKETNCFKKLKDGEERGMKKKRKKLDGANMEEKKPKKNRIPKQGGVPVLGVHRPEKKKRKKLMKDSLNLAAMLRRFSREKDQIRRRTANPTAVLPRGQVLHAKLPQANSAHAKNPSNDIAMGDLTSDPAMMSLLGSANNNEMLQDMIGDLDFSLLDSSPQPASPVHGENGTQRMGMGGGKGQGGILPPPPLPSNLPAPLTKRIEDLRAASRQFDQEGRKKFFTLDMNNILLDIELQVQEQPAGVRAAVYSHLEAFVPCNKEALLKRLKKLSLNIQDDRLRTPLLKLKLAVCSVMPEQIARYNMDCIAKVAKQQSEDGEKHGSEDEDEEKPGKRVMGPRKKFVWDDKLRTLLCTLVRVKLGCYELEGQSSLSPEDYLKAFMETEVKPLWPKGWMQARMLFKESIVVHGHLTGNLAKKKMVPTPKTKPKEGVFVQRSSPQAGASSSPQVPLRPSQASSEPICLDDDLAPHSLDPISQALALLSSAAKGLVHGDIPPTTPQDTTKNSSPLLQQHRHYVSASSPVVTSPSLSRPVSVSSSPSITRPVSVSSSPSITRPVSVSSSPSITRPVSVSSSPSLSRPVSVSSSPSLSRPASVSSSPSLSRPSSVSSTLSSGMGMGMVRGGAAAGGAGGGGVLSLAHRPSVLSSQRPSGTAMSKAHPPVSPSPAKCRPPPTSSPLLNPGARSGMATPPLGPTHKGSNNVKVSSGEAVLSGSPQSRPPPLPGVQSNFITPMQATLTKPSHSSNPPIIKLSPRTPSTPHPRPQTAPNMHQYSSKSPAGFRPAFSGAPGQVQGQKSSSQTSISANTSLTNSSPISKQHSGSSLSSNASPANQGQRQRSAGGTTQGTKPMTSVSSSSVASQLPQVSSAGGGLLASPPSLPLGFGMLGGLVPVSLPFQFPSLLNLPPLASAPPSSTASVTAASQATFSSLTQNLYKSLQSGAQVALPPHLQLAFSDVNQSQGGDVKRKSL